MKQSSPQNFRFGFYCLMAYLLFNLSLNMIIPSEQVFAVNNLEINKQDSDQEQAFDKKVTTHIRLLVKVQPYEKLSMRAKDGFVKEEFVPAKKIVHVLRARLERINHFYFDRWHIETIPQMFSRETKQYQLQLKIYQKYGVLGNLEEYVGDVTVKGSLQGEQHLYKLIGVAKKQFKNRNGEPLLAVEAGFNATDEIITKTTPPDTKDKDLAKRLGSTKRNQLQ